MPFTYKRTTARERKEAERQRMLRRYITYTPPSQRHAEVAALRKTSRSRPHRLRGAQEEARGLRVWRGRRIYDALLQRIGLRGLT